MVESCYFPGVWCVKRENPNSSKSKNSWVVTSARDCNSFEQDSIIGGYFVLSV